MKSYGNEEGRKEERVDVREERGALDAILFRESVSGGICSSIVDFGSLGKQPVMCAQREIIRIVFLHVFARAVPLDDRMRRPIQGNIMCCPWLIGGS